MIWPVVAYAPTAATKPSIAAQPLNFSASGVIVFYLCVSLFTFDVTIMSQILEPCESKEKEVSCTDIWDNTTDQS